MKIGMDRLVTPLDSVLLQRHLLIHVENCVSILTRSAWQHNIKSSTARLFS
jgi:hypothetical protein